MGPPPAKSAGFRMTKTDEGVRPYTRLMLPGLSGRFGLLRNLMGIWFLQPESLLGEPGDCGGAGPVDFRLLLRNEPHRCRLSGQRRDSFRLCDRASANCNGGRSGEWLRMGDGET